MENSRDESGMQSGNRVRMHFGTARRTKAAFMMLYDAFSTGLHSQHGLCCFVHVHRRLKSLTGIVFLTAVCLDFCVLVFIG